MNVDVIMLSWGKTKKLREMTQEAITSIISSSKIISFNIICVETELNVTYKNCNTIYPNEDFNFNKFLKYGYIASKGSPYVLFVNNDIVALTSFCEKLIEGLNNGYTCVSPLNPLDTDLKIEEKYTEGYSIYDPPIFNGWAFMMKRKVIDKIGINKLMPDILCGWFSDNYLTYILRLISAKHARVNSSYVFHFGSASIDILDSKNKHLYTHGQNVNYDKLISSLTPTNEKILERSCDFKVKYKFITKNVQDKQTRLHIKKSNYNFKYFDEEQKVDRIFMIHPEFLDSNNKVISEKNLILKSGEANIWILTPDLIEYHKQQLRPGYKGYFVEEKKVTTECEIIEILR